MSDESVLIAFIEEWNQYGNSDYRWPRRFNDAALAEIPEDDPYWPPLCRCMVSVTGDDAKHGSSKCCRVITITGHFNDGATDGLHDWLDKVEDLLRRLYWRHAEVLVLRSYSCPPLRLVYKPLGSAVTNYLANPPRACTGWTFEAWAMKHEPIDLRQIYQGKSRPERSEWP